MVSHRDQNSDKKLNSEDLETDAEVRKRPRGHEELRVLVTISGIAPAFFRLRSLFQVVCLTPSSQHRDGAIP
jgi:hypothetical protein